MRSNIARPNKRALYQPLVAWLSVLIALALMIDVGVRAVGRGPGHPLAVRVVEMSDPLQVGAVTRMTIRVANQGTTNVTPVFATFSSSNLLFPLAWRRTSGPALLAPGMVGLYGIQPNAEAAIASDDDFVVQVGDARTHTYAASPTTRARLDPPPAIANPTFKWWVTDPATGQPAPFGWRTTSFAAALGPHFGIEHSVIAGRQALAFRITDGVRTPRWRAIRVDQNIKGTRELAALFDHGFSVSVYPTFNYTPGFVPAGKAQPGNAFGIQIIGDARLLWIVFSDTGAGWYVGCHYAIVVLRSPLNHWTDHRVDLPAVYRKLRWSPPHDVVFSLFAAGRSGSTTRGPAFGPIIPGASGRSRADAAISGGDGGIGTGGTAGALTPASGLISAHRTESSRSAGAR